MDYKKILKCILDVGESMLKCGAETFRVEDSLYRMCKSYGFVSSDMFVIPTNIQATVETADGDIFTQVRHVANNSIDYDKLDYLNNLSRYICNNQPDEKIFHEKYMEVMGREEQPLYITYLAGIMGGTGFAVFFGSGFWDAIVAVIVSVMIVFVGGWLEKKGTGLVVYNMTLAFLSEIVILSLVHLGLGEHPERIMIGIVMLLISALGTTNGIRNLLNKDVLAGIINITNSLLGAVAIACGIALAMLLMKGVL